MNITFRLLILSLIISAPLSILQAQRPYWQQKVQYTMDVDMDVAANQFKGSQQIIYTNNSPDSLKNVYYHLYFNAFQPGSMMDVRSRTISDPDGRIASRLLKLSDDEIGYLKVSSLKLDGSPTKFETSGTILEVDLPKAIAPGASVTLSMEFIGQVPVQIRRSGRDNSEGVRLTMSQWYPKLAEYDYRGWHADPYIGREYYGIWGDFDVTLHIDREYTVAATGVLQNAKKIGHGYKGKKNGKPGPDNKLIWNFKAENVHDFVWAADPSYTHLVYPMKDGPELHFFYKKGENAEVWEESQALVAKAFRYMNEHFGKYPYPVYSVIQGGDGGMEYPMATLVTGERDLHSLVGVTIHELIHSWYYGLMGSNESRYAWMDEGFTTYCSQIVSDHVWDRDPMDNPFLGRYSRYFETVDAGLEEPLNTHSDHFQTNKAYYTSAYSKGVVFLVQLGYVIGQDAFDRSMLRYYDLWKFKHPEPNDFLRIAELESGMELDWYLDYFARTNHTIDYGIRSLIEDGGKTRLSLERIGKVPMPVEVLVEFKNGDKELYYMPLRIMRGEKPAQASAIKWVLAEDWPWTHPSYTLIIPRSSAEIKRIEIDPSKRMADRDRSNNLIEFQD